MFPKHSFFDVFRWQRNRALGTNGFIGGDIKCFTVLTIFLFSNSEGDNFEFAIELKERNEMAAWKDQDCELKDGMNGSTVPVQDDLINK